ncbi:MAG: hypothetical protein JSV24_02490 [Bacteroidales bacterium]|nr:MAG: hypothetical protein JSV24_02490 [Bacteroidales bacterium]
MEITYFDSLSRGWDRMKNGLFKPFDLGKWFVVGFTAFLAGLLDGPGGGGNLSGNKWDDFPKVHDIAEFPSVAWNWLMQHPLWTSLIFFGTLFLIAVIIVFTWLSSRGKFMFLDNVVHNKAEVTKPWHQYKREGDSLFLWRLVYGFIVFVAIVAITVFFVGLILNMVQGNISGPQKVYTIMGMVFLFLLFFIVISYINLFLDHFVVPIMYKHSLSAMQGWGRFLPLMSQHFGYFLLYGLIVFFLIIVVIFCVILFGLMTCCIGFLLLVIPYIGSVVILPVSYTFRAYSLEFLGQFGPEFEIFPPAGKVNVA